MKTHLNRPIQPSLLFLLFIVFDGFGLIFMQHIPRFAYFRIIALLFSFVYLLIREKGNIPFVKLSKCYLFFIFTNMVYSSIVRQQSFEEQLLINWPYYGLMSFYILYYFDLGYSSSVKIIKKNMYNCMCFLYYPMDCLSYEIIFVDE